MSILPTIVAVEDAAGERLDAKRSDGTRRPIILRAPAAFSGASAADGGLSRVTLGLSNGAFATALLDVIMASPGMLQLIAKTIPAEGELHGAAPAHEVAGEGYRTAAGAIDGAMALHEDAGAGDLHVHPSNLSPFAWWEAGQETYEDNPGTDAVEDADEVMFLGDLSGNSHDLVSTTSTQKPLYDAVDALMNGKPSLTYDGLNDRMVSDEATGTWKFLHDGTGGTIALVMRVGSTDGEYLFSTSNASPGCYCLRLGDGRIQARVVGAGPANIVIAFSTLTIPVGATVVMIFRTGSGEASECNVRINGVEFIDRTFTGATSSDDPVYPLTIGALQTSLTSSALGAFAAGGAWNRYLSDAEVADVEFWATNEYALSL